MPIYDQQYIKSRVTITDTGCWVWQGSVDNTGYGCVNRTLCGESRSHRLSYREFKGDIPHGMIVCHTCDNPPCCNPEHLFVGYASDNANDAVAKGRHKYVNNGGYNKISSEISAEIIKAINEGERKVVLAIKYDLAISTIYNIYNRQTQQETQP